ncbi:MAG: hypothetical protein Q8O37_06750 [Sulfuricellaceae bacterium]|nr:hypothetical protein [Sulfuricellaceae bacterium]
MTTPPDTLSLTLTTTQLDELAARFSDQFRNPAQVMSALVALQSLLALAPPGDQTHPAYRAMQEALNRRAEAARAALLQESIEHLLAALRSRDASAIARIHGSLSRNGFWQIATAAGKWLQANDTAGELDWLNSWVDAAKISAASPYPDTYDFTSSGIDPKTFAAMTELQRCLLSV